MLKNPVFYYRVMNTGPLLNTCVNLGRFIRGGSRTAATSKMECFVIIVNGFQPLTIITKRSILDVAAVLDSPLFIEKRPCYYVLINFFLTLNFGDTHRWMYKKSNSVVYVFVANCQFFQKTSHALSAELSLCL